MDMSFFLGVLLAIAVVVVLLKTARVVPQREQFVVERLGKYAKTLDAGFHILVPFVDVVAYKHTLKEQTVDVPSQSCITKDNISVEIDGVIYMQVSDARAASYGIQDYMFATAQLAQTTLRSEIGKIELDRTFEERETINSQVVHAVDPPEEYCPARHEPHPIGPRQSSQFSWFLYEKVPPGQLMQLEAPGALCPRPEAHPMQPVFPVPDA